MIRTLIFDWGGTIMEDPGWPGPMYLWEEVSLVPGARKALEELSRGFECCIATGAGVSDGPMMKLALERVGIAGFFRDFFSPKEVGYAKPDPEFFSEICRRIGVDPAACIMTGNDYLKDICGAREAGMHTILYSPGDLRGPFEKADRVIRNMEDLPEAVREIALLYRE